MKVVSTSNAPAAIGPYSQATRAGNLVFFSGQIPLDPATMQMVEGIDAQIERKKAGEPCGLFFKTNSITDKDVIEKIVEASQAGVNVAQLESYQQLWRLVVPEDQAAAPISF